MRTETITELLERYGQTVTIRKDGTEETGKAILQPFREKSAEQEMPSEVGVCRGDRFLYFGQAERSLEAGTGMQICWNGQGYRIRSAQPVYLGETILFWQAYLTPEGGEAL